MPPRSVGKRKKRHPPARQRTGMGVDEGMQVITAEVPQVETFKFCSELRSITGGRGSFELTFARYEQVASNIAQKIIAAAQKDKVAVED
jgi:elongation factor G